MLKDLIKDTKAGQNSSVCQII